MHDILSKKAVDNPSTWDTYLNSTLATITVNCNESTFSPFLPCLDTRHPVLPLDNLLKPRRKYTGEHAHEIAIQEQHTVFLTVFRNIKKARKKAEDICG